MPLPTDRPARGSSARRTILAAAVLLAPLAVGATWTAAPRQTAPGRPAQGSQQPPAPPPIDLQRWQDQQEMTWRDYRPIPGVNWATSTAAPARPLRVALVAIDFPDQPFVITLPKGSDPFGNPQAEPVRREDVPRFYADFFGRPGVLNHGQTINGFWMEQTRGQVGIPAIDAFGPYRMPRNLFEYGLNEWGQDGACPTGHVCDGRMEPDADALWQKDAGAEVKKRYDVILRIYAGYDETGVWQEFGEMKFRTKEDIPAEWGNPDGTKPRWAATRYVPWTSWRAGAQQWGLSSVRQGENSGTITHEIAHLTFRIGDNNNNPYIQPYRRVGSGPWDLMDRGSFNGPGGPHRRFVVPASEGAFMPAGLMLRSRMLLKLLQPGQVLTLSRDGLARSGLAVGTVTARAVEPGPGAFAGISVTLDGDPPRDRTPPCDIDADPLCAGPGWDSYSVEVVQRIGYDSFTPDNGVLVAKNKLKPDKGCGYGCFTWVVDAHPEDLNRLDFTRADGSAVMRTVADYRQLNDALFHAGLNSGSRDEWEDAANRLHFYVVGVSRDASGILSYVAGVRSLDGAGPHRRGVALSAPAASSLPADGLAAFSLRNTGAAAPIDGNAHPSDVTAAVGYDIYRVSAKVDGKGWSVSLSSALEAVRFGASTKLPVFVSRGADSAASATVTVSAASESDQAQTATASWTVRAR